MPKLTSDQVNYVNVGLMLAAAGLAFWRPFEVFLFVYAVLGPAHYLTEISWLHDRRYFTTGKYDYVFLIAASVLATLCVFDLVPGAPAASVTWLTLVAFAAAPVFALVPSAPGRVLGIAGALLLASLLADARGMELTFRLFLPTLIHVSIFTGAFILIGALRGRSLSGLVSLLVFLAVPFAFLYALPGREHYAVSGYARQAYGHLQDDGAFSDGFMGLNHQVLTIFNLHDFGQPTRDIAGFVRDVNAYLYGNPLALAVMAFIAFAYTYHYLNWFSKTSIIRWHEIPRARADHGRAGVAHFGGAVPLRLPARPPVAVLPELHARGPRVSPEPPDLRGHRSRDRRTAARRAGARRPGRAGTSGEGDPTPAAPGVTPRRAEVG